MPATAGYFDRAGSTPAPKFFTTSGCGRGITWTDMTCPTWLAASDPASVAALTAPTSPWTSTDTSPAPTCSRPMIVTLAAFTMASAAAKAATYPLVSTNPMAFDIFLSPSIDSRSGCLFIENADDQRVDNGLAVLEPSSGNRTRRHQHPFAGSSAQRIIGNEPLAGSFLFESDFKERSARQFAQPFRCPYISDHDACLHGLVLTSSSFNSRALSRASGVTTTCGP